MNHPELDELLDFVRNDMVNEEVRRHIDGCAQCEADLEGVVRLDTAAGRMGPVVPASGLVAPAGSVWDRVQADIALDTAVAPTRAGGPSAVRRPRRPMAMAAVAAVAGVAVGGIGGYLWAGGGTEPSERTPFAVGTLAPKGDSAVTGEVAVKQDASSRSLTVTFSDSVPGPGYVEAWLLDPATNEMLGLGVLGPEGGTVTVPADADLSRFTTVDISREPFDGDPAHSADSIARGVIRQL